MESAPTSARRSSHALRIALVLAATIALAFVATPATTAAPAAPRAAASTGELIVGFERNASPSRERTVVTAAGARIEGRLEAIDAVVVEPRAGGAADVIEELGGNDAVAFVEPNYVLRSSRIPNDPELENLWGLRNLGQFGGKPAADVSAAAAWDLLTGGPVTVAVIDTGVDYEHPDLAPNLWTNPAESANGQDDDHNGFVDDLHGADFLAGSGDPADDSGHGTHVAGVIGARGDNATGTVGVAWDVRLMALKFMDEHGEGTTADAAQAIDYAVAAGARVINASWGGSYFSHALHAAVERAAARGVLFVAAAGNEGANADSSPDYPAAFELPNVVSVAATDRNDSLVGFSNYGAHSVDLAAPGADIVSTVPTAVDQSGYAEYSGTSMATPFVSGAAALYVARSPASVATQVRDALLHGVDPLPSLAGKTVTGGRLNVAKTLGVSAAAAPPPTVQRDLTPPTSFRLLRPRNRYVSRRHAPRFRWQRSTDRSGILYYKVYVDGKLRKIIRDPDGRGGRKPKTVTRLRLSGGRHHWFVRAYDYAGNRRTAKAARRKGRMSVVYVGRRAGRR